MVCQEIGQELAHNGRPSLWGDRDFSRVERWLMCGKMSPGGGKKGDKSYTEKASQVWGQMVINESISRCHERCRTPIKWITDWRWAYEDRFDWIMSYVDQEIPDSIISYVIWEGENVSFTFSFFKYKMKKIIFISKILKKNNRIII